MSNLSFFFMRRAGWYLAAVLLLTVPALPGLGQYRQEKSFKNVVRLNLTGMALFGTNYIVAGYERVVFPHQTFSVNLGRPVLPGINIVESEGYHVSKNRKDNGYNASVDYRFYLAGENKFDAPRGVYIGPYYSFNYFTRENSWTLTTASYSGTARSDMDLMINVVGAELGYQFIIARRIALDFVMIGPGFALYDFNLNISGDGNLDPETKAKIHEKIGDALDQRFNGFEKAFSGNGFKSVGGFNSIGGGYRFLIHLGFNF